MGVKPTLSLHRVPCAPAMKLLRVLASAGRNIAARLVSRTQGKGWRLETGLGWGLSIAPALWVAQSCHLSLRICSSCLEIEQKPPGRNLVTWSLAYPVGLLCSHYGKGRFPVPWTQARRATYK